MRIKSRFSGFTLIEMLAVFAILVVLLSITLPSMSYVYRRAKIKAARGDIAMMELALEMYHSDFHAYPPDEAPASEDGDTGLDVGNGWGVPNADEGENLYYFGSARFVSGKNSYRLNRDVGPYVEFIFSDDIGVPTGNDDVDVEGDGTADDPILQIVDPWGNPYVYRENESDSSLTGTVNRQTFCLYSYGPDGLVGGEIAESATATFEDANGDGVDDDIDNITNWRRAEE